MDLRGLSLMQLIAQNYDSVEVFDYFYQRACKYNDELNAFLYLDKSSPKIKEDRKSQTLKAMPIALKDNILTKYQPTTAASRILDGFMSPYGATITHKLAQAGATIMGKTNMDAWAHGSSTETSDYGPTKNPYNTAHVAGGSSGGSAAAVAAGLVPAAIGTETAGSIRGPASWSGVVGLKPTYGRVSRYGIIAMGSSWDCPGPITQTVEDAAFLLEILAGHDRYDATSINTPVGNYQKKLKQKRKFVIGIADEYFDGVDDTVMRIVEDSIEMLAKMGHRIRKIHLIHPKYAVSVYMLLQRSEVSSNLGRYDGIRYGKNRSYFGQEAERRIMLGTYALSAGYYDQYYKKAQKVRYIIRENFEKVFSDIDVIFAPTMPITATLIGDIESFAFYGEQMDVLAEPASAAGIPAITIPAGFDKKGLPIGVQFIGPYLGEDVILQTAYQLEQETRFNRLSVMKKYE